MQIEDAMQLADWRRRTFDVYRAVRTSSDPAGAWSAWTAARAELFRTHPQSPIPAGIRGAYEGPRYFRYDPGLRLLGTLRGVSSMHYDIATSGDEAFAFTRFATVSFEVAGRPHELELYWLEGYGGGIFLPFRDATNATTTYGGGRYLLDTVKGADLGMDGDLLVLDFNFAYNPSCSYDPRWVCPLSPPENKLDISIEAGEQSPDA